MYKLTVPISAEGLTKETLPLYLKTVQECKAERVFVTLLDYVYQPGNLLETAPEQIEEAVRFFKQHGLETGIWLSAFGHGGLLSHQTSDTLPPFTQMAGAMGETCGVAYCPLDRDFAAVYRSAVQKLAAMHPDMILLDDDYRLNVRPYYMGCFCPLHLQEYEKRLGERIERGDLERLIFTGGPNKYRDAYMQLSADTLLDFSHMLRKAVDEVDPTIRLSACACYDNWDFCGTDNMAIARALAGNTAPYLRTIGAPYWNHHNEIIDVIEDTRMQAAWCKDSGIEIFTEGDVYPRPRYHVPAKPLEIYDLALLADGSTNGIMKYMFDYTLPQDYETGYTQRHIHNSGLREQVATMFGGKRPVGVYAHCRMHKIREAVLPKECESGIASSLLQGYRSSARVLLSKNSIPSAYEETGYPILLCGENARGVTADMLQNGAIVDLPAAVILQESSIDVGLLSYVEKAAAGEQFGGGRKLSGIDCRGQYAITCADTAEVESRFLPDNTPSAYRYTSSSGIRFLVLACDVHKTDGHTHYLNSYYRQEQLTRAILWLCGKPLPVSCPKNPSLYLLTAKGDGSMAVALANVFMDEILTPTIRLDKPYKRIRFAGCDGRLDGDTVTLSDLSPYAFAAFEVFE